MMETDMEKYILEHSSPEDEILSELNRKTYTSVLNPHMISGHIQGKLLEMLVSMIKPALVLEIGTYTGYSAISMARTLPAGAMLHTIEINDELEDMCREYIAKAGMENKIVLHMGDALKLMKKLNILFDLIFIDGDKRQYPEYYSLAFNMLNKKGYILVDNVLWGGKVTDPKQTDPMTLGIRRFNRMVKEDQRIEKIIIPLRDGLMLIRKT
ncbi:MAG TPA: O-methyltransferase [Bacteroidaceae bacterium]|nr:O-methyltransferase [Bacteroidaceae bacterium]